MSMASDVILRWEATPEQLTALGEALESLGGGAVLRKPFHLAEVARVLCELANKAPGTRLANGAPRSLGPLG